MNLKAESKFDKVHLSNILILQFLTIVPLSIVGWDYGRWTFFWVTTSFAVYLFVPSEKVSILFPGFISKSSSKINAYLDSVFSRVEGLVYILPLIIGVPICGWSFNYYFQSTPLIIVFRFVSRMIHSVFILMGMNLS
jgi:hypothetical protein